MYVGGCLSATQGQGRTEPPQQNGQGAQGLGNSLQPGLCQTSEPEQRWLWMALVWEEPRPGCCHSELFQGTEHLRNHILTYPPGSGSFALGSLISLRGTHSASGYDPERDKSILLPDSPVLPACVTTLPGNTSERQVHGAKPGEGNFISLSRTTHDHPDSEGGRCFILSSNAPLTSVLR